MTTMIHSLLAGTGPLGFAEGAARIAEVRRQTARTDATTPTLSDPEKQQARHIHRDGRVVVLPPEGYGDIWNGGAR